MPSCLSVGFIKNLDTFNNLFWGEFRLCTLYCCWCDKHLCTECTPVFLWYWLTRWIIILKVVYTVYQNFMILHKYVVDCSWKRLLLLKCCKFLAGLEVFEIQMYSSCCQEVLGWMIPLIKACSLWDADLANYSNMWPIYHFIIGSNVEIIKLTS